MYLSMCICNRYLCSANDHNIKISCVCIYSIMYILFISIFKKFSIDSKIVFIPWIERNFKFSQSPLMGFWKQLGWSVLVCLHHCLFDDWFWQEIDLNALRNRKISACHLGLCIPTGKIAPSIICKMIQISHGVETSCISSIHQYTAIISVRRQLGFLEEFNKFLT